MKRSRRLTLLLAPLVGITLCASLTSTMASASQGTATASSEARKVNNSRMNPAVVAYGPSDAAKPYAKKGALVIAGRENYNAQSMKNVSRAGGTVLVYTDAIIDNPYGRYHELLHKKSACGPATKRWPGSPKANEWGYLTDFRPGSTVQKKLPCVLRTIANDNPHIGGFFADDLGSRSWFPGFSWENFGQTNREAYRKGAVALMKKYRKVANENGLIVMVNGTWQGGLQNGGGYPNVNEHGNALADGTFAENHSADAYWGRDYPCAPQWANQSPITNGKHFNFAMTKSAAVREDFKRTGCYAFGATQQYYDYANVWGSFSYTGLPTRVKR